MSYKKRRYTRYFAHLPGGKSKIFLLLDNYIKMLLCNKYSNHGKKSYTFMFIVTKVERTIYTLSHDFLNQTFVWLGLSFSPNTNM